MLLCCPFPIIASYMPEIVQTIDWLINCQDRAGNWPTRAPDLNQTTSGEHELVQYVMPHKYSYCEQFQPPQMVSRCTRHAHFTLNDSSHVSDAWYSYRLDRQTTRAFRGISPTWLCNCVHARYTPQRCRFMSRHSRICICASRSVQRPRRTF